MNTVLSYSGGLDSYFAREYLYQHKEEFDCVYFNHGGRYCENEVKRIKSLPFLVMIRNSIQLKDIERKDAFIPNRNILFSTMLNSYGYDKVYIGGTKSDRIMDNNKEVFDSLSKFLRNLNGKNFIVTSPFWDVYKTDVIKWFLKIRNNDIYNVADELLKNTFSCYDPLEFQKEWFYFVKDDDKEWRYKTEECMNCPACFRKNVELFSIGIFVPFYNLDVIHKYRNEIKLSIKLNTRMEATTHYINELVVKGFLK